jgi:methionyl-tRNA formyltransferase
MAETPTAPPGQVVRVGPAEIAIAAGGGVVQLVTIQPSGKRTMDVAEFLRGHKVQVGELFT